MNKDDETKFGPLGSAGMGSLRREERNKVLQDLAKTVISSSDSTSLLAAAKEPTLLSRAKESENRTKRLLALGAAHHTSKQ